MFCVCVQKLKQELLSDVHEMNITLYNITYKKYWFCIYLLQEKTSTICIYMKTKNQPANNVYCRLIVNSLTISEYLLDFQKK